MNRTRSSDNWAELPGSFDTLNTRLIFPSDNIFGIPELKTNAAITLPQWLIPYRTRVRNPTKARQGAVHFFLDDFRFEVVWSRPYKTLSGLSHFGAILTPDFSLPRDWPRAIQLYNTYRNRWLGAFWHSYGLKVIPTISWSTPHLSYDFCFVGIPPGGMVALAPYSPATTDRKARLLFRLGFEEMLRQLTPSKILCYGKLDEECARLAYSGPELMEIINFPSRWQSWRAGDAPAAAFVSTSPEYSPILTLEGEGKGKGKGSSWL